MRISVVVPVYNEESSIVSVVNALYQTMLEIDKPFEIIVVNDCSSDRTKEAVATIEVPVILVEHTYNKGYGAALKTGIARSQYDYIVITDADGTYPNEKIIDLVDAAFNEKHEMVVGARIGATVRIPFIRKPAKWFITQLANYLIGTKIPDLNSGLRLMRKDVLMKFLNILPDTFSFTSTITLAMMTNNYSVKFIPVDYYHREGKSKIKPIRDTLNFIQLIIRTVLYFKPLKIFIPLSLFLVLLAFIILFVGWYCFGYIFDVSFGVTIMNAVVVLAIGMLADLIDKRLEK